MRISDWSSDVCSSDLAAGTMTASGSHAVVATFLAQHNTMPHGGVHAGHDARSPVSTVSSTGAQQQVVTSHLLKLRGTCKDGQPIDEPAPTVTRSEEHTSELQSLMRISYAVFCLKTKKINIYLSKIV